MRLYTAYDNATKQYVATLAGCDGVEEHVRFASAKAFRTWLGALEARLEREQNAADPAPLPNRLVG
jgi:hypothetical protein